jgi:hypothetical protein
MEGREMRPYFGQVAYHLGFKELAKYKPGTTVFGKGLHTAGGLRRVSARIKMHATLSGKSKNGRVLVDPRDKRALH